MWRTQEIPTGQPAQRTLNMMASEAGTQEASLGNYPRAKPTVLQVKKAVGFHAVCGDKFISQRSIQSTCSELVFVSLSLVCASLHSCSMPGSAGNASSHRLRQNSMLPSGDASYLGAAGKASAKGGPACAGSGRIGLLGAGGRGSGGGRSPNKP